VDALGKRIQLPGEKQMRQIVSERIDLAQFAPKKKRNEAKQ